MPQHYNDEFKKRNRISIDIMSLDEIKKIMKKKKKEKDKNKKKNKNKKASDAGEVLKEERRQEQLDTLKEVKGSKELTGSFARKFLKENQKRNRN